MSTAHIQAFLLGTATIACQRNAVLLKLSMSSLANDESSNSLEHISSHSTHKVGSASADFLELSSIDRRFTFSLEPTGNIVLRGDGRPLWSSNTRNHATADGPHTLKLQADGNLCAYNWQGKCFWASGTHGRGVGPFCLIMQEDGNCVLYDSKGSATWATGTCIPPPFPWHQFSSMQTFHPALWHQSPSAAWQNRSPMPPPPPPSCMQLESKRNATRQQPVQAPPGLSRVEQRGCQNTELHELVSEDGRFHLLVQTDRNIVLFKHRDPIWASNTTASDARDGPYFLALQADGNLCGYNAQGQCFWSSNTYTKGVGPFSLVMQDDGNCVLYDSLRHATWHTDTWKHA